MCAKKKKKRQTAIIKPNPFLI